MFIPTQLMEKRPIHISKLSLEFAGQHGNRVTHLSVAVSAGMLQRKVKEMTMKRKERKAGMWWQELPHFPVRARPSSPHDTLPTTQLHPEYT